MIARATTKSISTHSTFPTVACIRSIMASGHEARSTPAHDSTCATNCSTRATSADSSVRLTSKLSLSGFSSSTSSISFSNIRRNSALPIFSCLEQNVTSRTIALACNRAPISAWCNESTVGLNSTLIVTFSRNVCATCMAALIR